MSIRTFLLEGKARMIAEKLARRLAYDTERLNRLQEEANALQIEMSQTALEGVSQVAAELGISSEEAPRLMIDMSYATDHDLIMAKLIPEEPKPH